MRLFWGQLPKLCVPFALVFGVEMLASALLMAVILIMVFTKGLRGFGGIATGWIVGLDIFFWSVCLSYQ